MDFILFQTMTALIRQQENRLIMLAAFFLLFGGSVGYAGSKVPSNPETTTTVILICHAERDNSFNITGWVEPEKGHTSMGIYIYTIPDQGPVIVVKSRYGS